MQRLPLIYVDVHALRPGTVGAYGLSFLAAAIATALQLAIEPYVGGVQYVTFFPAVIITAMMSGLGAGMLCLVLSVGAVAFFLLTPRFSFHIEHLSDLLTISLFILMTFSIVILIAGMRFAIERCQDINHGLRQQAVALQQQTVALCETEERLTLTAAELQHRTRNLISVVGTIADNTLRTSRTFEEFKAHYHGRLQTLGRAQGLLSRKREGRSPLTNYSTPSCPHSPLVWEKMDRLRWTGQKTSLCAPAQSRRLRWSCMSWSPTRSGTAHLSNRMGI